MKARAERARRIGFRSGCSNDIWRLEDGVRRLGSGVRRLGRTMQGLVVASNTGRAPEKKQKAKR